MLYYPCRLFACLPVCLFAFLFLSFLLFINSHICVDAITLVLCAKVFVRATPPHTHFPNKKVNCSLTLGIVFDSLLLNLTPSHILHFMYVVCVVPFVSERVCACARMCLFV